MLVVLASRHDNVAQELVARWAESGAALLTCADLSVPGWRYLPDEPERSTAVVSGRTVAQRDIAGVLVRLPYVSEAEVSQITTSERSYVATEMSAFLLSWLTALQCPVLNRPTPTCLAGPYWRHPQWLHAAAQLGIPVYTTGADEGAGVTPSSSPPASRTTVTVVGDQCFGSEDEHLMAQARRLATTAGVELLAVHFLQNNGTACFLGVDLIPDVSCPAVADSILSHLLKE